MKNERYVDIDRVFFAIEMIKERSARSASGDYKMTGRACDMLREMIQDLPSCQPVSLIPEDVMEAAGNYAQADYEYEKISALIDAAYDKGVDWSEYVEKLMALRKQCEDARYDLVSRTMQMCGYFHAFHNEKLIWSAPDQDQEHDPLPFQ